MGGRGRTFVECQNALFPHGLKQNIHGPFLQGVVRECRRSTERTYHGQTSPLLYEACIHNEVVSLSHKKVKPNWGQSGRVS